MGGSDDRWQRVNALLGQALERPEDERDAWLIAACNGDAGLLAEVRELLQYDAAQTGGFRDAIASAAGPMVAGPAARRAAAAATPTAKHAGSDPDRGAMSGRLRPSQNVKTALLFLPLHCLAAPYYAISFHAMQDFMESCGVAY